MSTYYILCISLLLRVVIFFCSFPPPLNLILKSIFLVQRLTWKVQSQALIAPYFYLMATAIARPGENSGELCWLIL